MFLYYCIHLHRHWDYSWNTKLQSGKFMCFCCVKIRETQGKKIKISVWTLILPKVAGGTNLSMGTNNVLQANNLKIQSLMKNGGQQKCLDKALFVYLQNWEFLKELETCAGDELKFPKQKSLVRNGRVGMSASIWMIFLTITNRV